MPQLPLLAMASNSRIYGSYGGGEMEIQTELLVRGRFHNRQIEALQMLDLWKVRIPTATSANVAHNINSRWTYGKEKFPLQQR